MNPPASILRFFFFQLYHSLAWSYDLVAAIVSIGRWNAWVESILPFIKGGRVLELGHGPGYLQSRLSDLKRFPIGLDESRQMSALATHRLRRANRPVRLVRGTAQFLPFTDDAFDTVLATFPSEYIFEARTVSEVRRVLRAGGRLVVLPAAWIKGRAGLDWLAAWLFRVTGESPRGGTGFEERIASPFKAAGFEVKIEHAEVRSSTCLFIIAEIEGQKRDLEQ